MITALRKIKQVDVIASTGKATEEVPFELTPE